MRTYNKPPKTFDEQIQILENRGLIINDRARAKRHLSNVSYYRMSAYMLPFKKRDASGKPLDEFVEGTTWDDVYSLYKFDRKLRLLVFDAIERIEIALRTQVIYQLSHKYGSHWQNQKALFMLPKHSPKTGKSYDVFADVQNHINDQLNANKRAVFIEHYMSTYDNPPTPPSWMSVELLYFSELSKICQNLKSRKDRTDIAAAFGIADETIFCSWLHTLNYLRNICAHHARLWNIEIDVNPKKYFNKNQNYIWLSNEEIQSAQTRRLYYSLCLILYLLQSVNPNTKFREHFRQLLEDYPVVKLGYMGFPKDWEQHPLWAGKISCKIQK